MNSNVAALSDPSPSMTGKRQISRIQVITEVFGKLTPAELAAFKEPQDDGTFKYTKISDSPSFKELADLCFQIIDAELDPKFV